MFNKLLKIFTSVSEGYKPFDRQDSLGTSVIQLLHYIHSSPETRTLSKDRWAVDVLQHIARETKNIKNKEKETKHVL
jgi:hypothetical protein